MECLGTKCSLTIALAAALPAACLIIIAAFVTWRLLRRKSRLFKRGITPIDDEEIESWKIDRSSPEKALSFVEPPTSPWHDSHLSSQRSSHRHTSSITSTRKPASIIIYQSSQPVSRGSEDMSPSSPHGIEVPSTPVLARAPNARPGLTDEAIQGDDPFISYATYTKRQPCRLAKPPPRASQHSGNKGSRATVPGTSGSHDSWFGQQSDYQRLPRRSADQFFPGSPAYRSEYQDMYSTRSTPMPTPRRSSFEEDIRLGGLSPRPLVRKAEIGRAIG
ncbi:hypothetical protein HIM_03982 [Hirsutella minnesotensis 3608]|uniref:Uncharacterized protein n=1 Tax=Hirsutella minnesotensis 3608 TaxID=1043627 RepID=A0A0F7ZLT1_9HYPO|nr:hypothetical protein HIM_03982 [Hirsutella minnesotensis 3608]